MEAIYNCLTTLSMCVVFLLCFGKPTFAQKTDKDQFHEYSETPDDPYIPVAKNTQPTSPAYHFVGPNVLTVQVNVNQDGENIQGDAANEPSLAVHPLNPAHMIIGWRQFDTIASNFRQAGFAYTINNGNSWTFPGVIEPGVFRSDPVLDFDAMGQIFYNSLTRNQFGTFICDVFQSTGIGTWDEGVYAYGGDKQWMTIDRTGGIGDGHIYANWKPNLSSCVGSFTRSSDGGNSFEDCVGTLGEPIRGTVTVGPDGSLYAFGHVGNNFVLSKSSTAKDATMPVTWDFSTGVPMGGSLGLYDGPNPNGMLAQAWVAADHSGGPTHGNVYTICSVERDNLGDPLDVMFNRSVDGGQTWGEPIRINDDLLGGAWQWFGTLSVAPNGRIDVVWLDTRLDPTGFDSALFYAHSTDGGQTWSPNQQLSETFDPHLGWPNQQKMGDYFHMISDDEGAHLAWAATFNGGQDVYYSFITPELVNAVRQENTSLVKLENYPNPFREATTISFNLETPGQVQLIVYDAQGKLIKVLDKGQKNMGQHNTSWYGRNDQGILAPSGIYFYELRIDGSLAGAKKMMKMGD